eukprot:TRINITY_DN11425_c0_g2_i3.p1 TRINITY_DN11425_c0_g2~~TRINITY_DN11425_c0_g2_i3.p1  ORF type:complete len:521 (+),score=71.42 TRINITY_DN11425_c0_g2_i3:97-1659(+)
MGARACCEKASGRSDVIDAPRLHWRDPSADFHHGDLSTSRYAKCSSRPVPPPGWGAPSQVLAKVCLRQAEGHASVRIFLEPCRGALILCEAPSGSVADCLECQGNFLKVNWNTVTGWVGAKNASNLNATSTVGAGITYPSEAVSYASGPNPAPFAAAPAMPNPFWDFSGAPSPDSLSKLGSTAARPPMPRSPHETSRIDACHGVYFSTDGRGRLAPRDGCYTWIRKLNRPEDRSQRYEGAQQTLKACKAAGFLLDGCRVMLRHIPRMCSLTRLVRADKLQHMGSSGCALSVQHHSSGLLMDVALSRVRAGFDVVIVNAASAYHTGGGFTTGGRHALEESICMQSTLYQSLLNAKQQACRRGMASPSCCMPPLDSSGKPWQSYIPQDGCIVSPSVEVFRAGTNEGYAFADRVQTLAAVVSVAMPNTTVGLHDAPVDVPADLSEYSALLVHKFLAVLQAAWEVLHKSPCNALVVPDLGCGIYGNEPSQVGHALGEALRRGAWSFSELHLVGQSAFARAMDAA